MNVVAMGYSASSTQCIFIGFEFFGSHIQARSMRFAILFAIQSVGILFFAVRFGGWMWVLAWPAISFAYVALAYFLNRPGMFAKSSNGEIPGWLAALLAPYFLMTWSVWMTVKYLSGENAYDEIDSQLILGRRVTVGELPAGVDRVVDLTAEFTEPRAIRDRVDYSLHRILGGHQPALDAFSVFARELAASSDVLFVHCAQGHGRTGCWR